MIKDLEKKPYTVVKTFLKVLAILLVVLPLTTSAQIGFQTNLSISPTNPQPGEIFYVTLNSTETDLSRATISWYLDDIFIVKGVGSTGLSSTARSAGESLGVKVVIETIDGKIIRASTFMRPQELDLLWYAHTYTPPFYKGLSLPSSASYVIITAMPNFKRLNGQTINPTNLVYTWTQGGIILGNASGYGRQTITLENGQIPRNPLVISVEVADLNKTVYAEKTLVMPFIQPDIIFYEKHSLKGILYNNAIDTLTIGGGEYVIRAEPYFFSTDDVGKNLLEYQWKVNNTSINTKDFPIKNEMILRADEDEEDSFEVSLNIRNNNLPYRILQEVKKILNINTR